MFKHQIIIITKFLLAWNMNISELFRNFSLVQCSFFNDYKLNPSPNREWPTIYSPYPHNIPSFFPPLIFIIDTSLCKPFPAVDLENWVWAKFIIRKLSYSFKVYSYFCVRAIKLNHIAVKRSRSNNKYSKQSNNNGL